MSSSDSFQELINQLEDGYFELNTSGDLVLVNEALTRMFGYSCQELIGMNNREYMDEPTARLAEEIFKRVYRTGKPEKGIEYEIIKKDGSRAAVELSVSPIKDGKQALIGFRGIIRDITARKDIEKRLRASEARYRSILEEINELYFEIDLTGHITYANQVMKTVLGYAEDELVGFEARRLIDIKERSVWDKAREDLKQLRTVVPADLTLLDKSRSQLITECRLFSAFNDEGKITGVRCVARDITKRKKVEQELAQYQSDLEKMVGERTRDLQQAMEFAERANQAKTTFLANISHELRTPLHSILSFSRFGLDKIDSSDKENNFHYFKRINQAGYQLMFLVNDLLDLANLEAGKTEYLMSQNDLASISRFVFQGFENKIVEKGLQIQQLEPTISTQVVCDSNKITQVIQNLMSNAIRYSTESGTITISFDEMKLDINGERIPAIQFSISDQGIGIPENELESVFEKFVQSSRTDTGAGGTGLGLSICHEIIHGHRGKIWAKNNETGGTTVCFAIPYLLDTRENSP